MNGLHTTCCQVKTVGFSFSVLHKLEWTIDHFTVILAFE